MQKEPSPGKQEQIKRDIQKNKVKYTTAKDTAMKEYNQKITYLVNCIYMKRKRDDDIAQIKERISLLRTTDPIMLIERSGPLLVKYKDQILKGDVKFFMDNDFQEDIDEQSSQHGDTGHNPHELMLKIKETWGHFNPAEHNIIIQTVQIMLQKFAQYLFNDRELKKCCL